MSGVDTGRCPVTDFDHHSPGFYEDPGSYLAAIRSQHPIAWTNNYGGFWVVTGHDEVHDVLKNPEVFSSARTDPELVSLTVPMAPSPRVLPEESDPPDWQGYRRFFNPILSPGSVNELRPLISKWTTYFIDQIIESGRGDLIYDVASPIPASVTLEWLGFPPEDWKKFAEPIHDVSGSAPGTERHDRAREGFGSILESINATVDDRKMSPRDDIVSRLVRYEIDGQIPADADLHSMILMTLEGGIDTTTSLTGSALVHLDRTPEDRRLLMEHPELLVQATEEFLRVYPPAMAHARTVRSDVEFHGVSMKKGDRVLVSWYSANHDPKAVIDPERVDLGRFPNRHASFGLGIHRCVGSHLARTMFQEIMTQLLVRLPDFRLEENIERYPDFGVISGWTSLPAVFTPGTRRLPRSREV